jgi:ribosomal protein S12 methylthiotransferase accessory factor
VCCARQAVSTCAANQEANANSFRLAPDVRIVAAREGAIISSAEGCFRLMGKSASRFVIEVLPSLYSGMEAPDADDARDFLAQLEVAQIVRASEPKARPASSEPRFNIAVIRETPLTRIVESLVIGQIHHAKSSATNTILISDLSGLTVEACLELLRQVPASGSAAITVWRRGPEIFYGLFSGTLHTACWNCSRLRFSDSAFGDNAVIEDESAVAQVVAENVLLGVRYPDVAGWGFVLIDNGEVSSLHSVVPVPWCEICGGPIPGLSYLPPLTRSLHVPEDLRLLADTRGGILRRVFIFEDDGTKAPAIPLCASALVSGVQAPEETAVQIQGEGKGGTRQEASASAIGEALERYSASLWHPSSLTYGSFAELGDRAFDARWLVLYDESQYTQPGFPFVPFAVDRPLYWTTGQWLDTSEEVLLPALATYMNWPTEEAARFGQTSSNGLAAGTSLEDACLRALYELIERDAFMLFWLARLPAQHLTEDGCNEIVYRALREVERFGAKIELYLLDAGTRHPTIVCLGLGDGYHWPGVTIGLGTHADPDVALQRAVLEHGHYGTYIRRLMGEGAHRKIRREGDVHTNLDHGLYYVNPARVTALDYFRCGEQPALTLADLRSRYSQKAALSTCVLRLLEAGVRTAVVDVTSPDLRLSTIRVVRAFGTYLQPIHFGFGNRRLKNPRLERLLSGAAETAPHPIA